MACASYPRSPKARQTVQSGLYERNSETLLRQAGQGTANAYKAGFENAAVELLNDKLVHLDIATGALTPLPAGRELLERLEQTA